MLARYWIAAVLPIIIAEEVCLLTLHARAGRTGVALLADRHRQLKEWATQHAKKRAALAVFGHKTARAAEAVVPVPQQLVSNVDDFITSQGASTDSCHAKILEVRRTLDGILRKVAALSDETEGSEAVIEGNTLVIKEAVENKEQNDVDRESQNDICDDTHAKAIEDLQKYLDELKELDQIAEPSVRSQIATDIDYKHEVEKHTRAINLSIANGPSFLEKENCHKFASFMARRNATTGRAATYAALDCNATRAVLQVEFTKSYTEISKLHAEGVKLANEQRDDCKDAVTGEHAQRQGQLDAVIRDATKNINGAKDSLQELTPLLNTAKEEVEKLQKHIENLKSSCDIEGDVTEHLVKIRQLIHSLEECPGRNDFKLTVPTLPSS